jgi:hypothetical protein
MTKKWVLVYSIYVCLYVRLASTCTVGRVSLRSAFKRSVFNEPNIRDPKTRAVHIFREIRNGYFLENGRNDFV